MSEYIKRSPETQKLSAQKIYKQKISVAMNSNYKTVNSKNNYTTKNVKGNPEGIIIKQGKGLNI